MDFLLYMCALKGISVGQGKKRALELLGIDYETGDKWKFLEFHYAFFLKDDSIFFVGNDGITQVNRFTRRIVKLDIPTAGNISFDGENIFYNNEQGVLTRYYISRTDGGCLYSCSKEGNNKELISNIPAMLVTCDVSNIYVVTKERGEKIVFKNDSGR